MERWEYDWINDLNITSILDIGACIAAVLGTQPLDAELLNPGNRAKS